MHNSIKQLTTVMRCYILFVDGGKHMHIIINNSSMVPIYEQIIDQIKSAIIRGELQPDTVLPSVRSLSKELRSVP